MKIYTLPLLIFGLLLIHANPIIASQTGGSIKRGHSDVDPDRQSDESDSESEIEQRQKRIRLAYAACLATKCYPTCTCPKKYLEKLADEVEADCIPGIKELIKAGVCPDGLNSGGCTAFHYASSPHAVTILCLDNPNRLKNPNIEILDRFGLTPAEHLAHCVFLSIKKMQNFPGVPSTEVALYSSTETLPTSKQLIAYGADYSLGLTTPTLSSDREKMIDNHLPALAKQNKKEGNNAIDYDFLRKERQDAREAIQDNVIPLIKVSQMGVKGMKSLTNKPLDPNRPFDAIKARQYFATRQQQPRIQS